MRTSEEIRNDIAAKHGFQSWRKYEMNWYGGESIKQSLNEATDIYMREHTELKTIQIKQLLKRNAELRAVLEEIDAALADRNRISLHTDAIKLRIANALKEPQ